MKISQNSREKIGLVVFVVAILAIFAGVATYMYFSHAFDLTASGIDENVGQLDDYSTLVFEGDNNPRTQKKTPTDGTPILQNTDIGLSEVEGQDQSDKQNSGLSNPENSGLSNSENSGLSNSENSVNKKEPDDPNYHYENATVKNVRQLYRDKGSTTAEINVKDYKAYENGEIIERGDWRIGVLSITQSNLDNIKNAKASAVARKDSSTPVVIEEFQKKISNLRLENHASLVVVISPDQSIVDYVSKVDCVIARNVKDDVGDYGKKVNDTFVMRIPDAGIIGAIVSSPAKMLSGNLHTRVEVKNEE